MIGLLWGLWHLPVIVNGYNYPGHPVAGPMMMTLLAILVSPLIGYVRLRAESVFAAAVFHGTFNAAATLGIFLSGGNVLVTGITGVIGMVTLLLADGVYGCVSDERALLSTMASASNSAMCLGRTGVRCSS